MQTITVQAIYEKGVLKPKKKLNLPEHSSNVEFVDFDYEAAI